MAVKKIKTELQVGDYILPSTDGSIGQSFETDGAGDVEWDFHDLLSLAPISDNTVVGNTSGATATPVEVSISTDLSVSALSTELSTAEAVTNYADSIITDGNITLAGIETIAGGTVVGNMTAGVASPSETAVETDLSLSALSTALVTAEAVKTYVDNLEPTDISIDEEAGGADTTISGIKTVMTVGELVAFGDVLYMKSDEKLWKSSANSETTTPVIAIAAMPSVADGECEVLLQGFVRNDSWSWTVGGEIYAGETSGTLTQTAPSDTNDVIQILGIATHADRMYFNPSLTNIVHV